MLVRRKALFKWASYLVLLLVMVVALSACERQLQGLLDNVTNPEGVQEEQPGEDQAEAGEDAEMAPGLDVNTGDPNAGETGEDAEGEPAAEEEAQASEQDQPVEGIPADDPTPLAPVEETAATEESPRPADAATPEAETTEEADPAVTAKATPTPGEAAAEEMAEEAAQATQETTEETPEATAEAPAEATEESTAQEETVTVEPTAAAAAEMEATAATGQERIHVVRAGENLYRIGLQYGVSWAVLAQVNNLPNANALFVGQELRIPADPNAGGTPTPTPQPPASQTTYTVKPGDTLGRIARPFNLTWTQIAEANGLVNPNRIYVGQVLKIPGSAPAPQLTHIVQARETLYLIALRYGVPWTTIASANNLAAPYVIYPGQVLTIPGDSN